MSSLHAARGFTIIEVILTIALFSSITAFSMLVDMSTYRSSSFRSDRDLLIALLMRARAESISKMCHGARCRNGMPHGVTKQDGKYVLFEGSDFASRDPGVDASFDANPVITYAESSSPVFSRLSATTTGSTITLTDAAGHASVITIGTEGQISWSN